MRKTRESIYSILVSRLIISKIIETKCLLECLLRHFCYLLINRESFDCRLDSSNDERLYRKSSNTHIKEIDMFVDKVSNKSIKSYCLLKQ